MVADQFCDDQFYLRPGYIYIYILMVLILLIINGRKQSFLSMCLIVYVGIEVGTGGFAMGLSMGGVYLLSHIPLYGCMKSVVPVELYTIIWVYVKCSAC